MKGRIFDISRMCHRDGPGIRTTVFFKGCPLHCPWCHNPEGLSTGAQVMYTAGLCLHCGACCAVCKHQCHGMTADHRHEQRPADCTGCGSCAAACPSGALRIAGVETDVESLADRVARDAPFFRYSGGGATLSGGEVLFQPEFALALLHALRKRNIHTCIETSGCRADDAARRVLEAADLVLLDCKHTDADILHRLTGLAQPQWDACLAHLERIGKPVILRCPVIPGANMDVTHAQQLGRLAAEHPCILRVELLPYHELGQSKHAAMGTAGEPFCVPSAREMHTFADHIRSQTDKPVIVL